jgi:hypothetical protein
MPVYSFNPLEDPRWEELGQRHPHASVFHTTGWLKALQRTHGYKPIVYTTSPPGATLTNGIVFCRIRSWLTGRRLVSLPFADHCEPLVERTEQLREILSSLQHALEEEKLKYVEIRPLRSDLSAEPCVHKSDLFCFHVLDLRPPLEHLFRGFHKDSIQRRIRRARREALSYEEGRSEELLRKFYHLMVLTRRRHKLPPQPIEWFRNLLTYLGDRVTIRVVHCRQRPVASSLTLRHLATLVYKYGCSDARYHHLGSVPFLVWKTIRAAKEGGMQTFDFGRSDIANEGLASFKDHFGMTRSVLAYERICTSPAPKIGDAHSMHFAQRIFAHMPVGLLTMSGRLLYRHIA